MKTLIQMVPRLGKAIWRCFAKIYFCDFLQKIMKIMKFHQKSMKINENQQSLDFIDFHWFSMDFHDFHGFSKKTQKPIFLKHLQIAFPGLGTIYIKVLIDYALIFMNFQDFSRISHFSLIYWALKRDKTIYILFLVQHFT